MLDGSMQSTPRGGVQGVAQAVEEKETANLLPRCSMVDLRDDYKYNKEMREQIEALADHYCGFRPIRGDGNCYYRAVGFSFLERAMCTFEE